MVSTFFSWPRSFQFPLKLFCAHVSLDIFTVLDDSQMVKFFKSLSLLCFFVVMIPHGAQAYEVDIQLFKPATGTGSLWSTESAQMGKHLGYRAGLQLQYARDPLVLSISQSAGSQGEVGALVANRFDAALTLTVALWEWVEVGLSVPLILQGGAEGEAFDAAGLEVGLGALSAVSVGDIRVVPRSKLFGLGDGALDVAVGVGVVLPSGSPHFIYRPIKV